jgi:putative transposase
MDTHTSLTDRSDAEWHVVQPLLPSEQKQTGRPRQPPLCTSVNAIVYELRAGCAWHLLPHEWPPRQTLYHSFGKWRLDGTWERVHLVLREQLRIRLGHDPEPQCGLD